jgi:hypothetical protein
MPPSRSHPRSRVKSHVEGRDRSQPSTRIPDPSLNAARVPRLLGHEEGFGVRRLQRYVHVEWSSIEGSWGVTSVAEPNWRRLGDDLAGAPGSSAWAAPSDHVHKLGRILR